MRRLRLAKQTKKGENVRMKRIICVSLIGLMTGCMSLHETTMTPVTEEPQELAKKKIGIQGFDYKYETYQNGHGTTFNSDGTVGSSSYRHRTTETSNAGTSYVYHKFEELGVNTRNKTPDLLLVGEMGKIKFPFLKNLTNSILTVGTLMIYGARQQETWNQIRVYNSEGEFLKEYYSEAEYSYKSLGVPLHIVAVDKLKSENMSIEVAKRAINKNLNSFLADYNQGFYDSFFKKEVKTIVK